MPKYQKYPRKNPLPIFFQQDIACKTFSNLCLSIKHTTKKQKSSLSRAQPSRTSNNGEQMFHIEDRKPLISLKQAGVFGKSSR